MISSHPLPCNSPPDKNPVYPLLLFMFRASALLVQSWPSVKKRSPSKQSVYRFRNYFRGVVCLGGMTEVDPTRGMRRRRRHNCNVLGKSSTAKVRLSSRLPASQWLSSWTKTGGRPQHPTVGSLDKIGDLRCEPKVQLSCSFGNI